MTFTFVTSHLNHHLLPFCIEMHKHLGDSFKVVLTETLPEERIRLGFEDMNKAYPFVIRAYDSKESYQEAVKLANACDVCLLGGVQDDFIRERLKKDRLTFYYSERLFKEGKKSFLKPKIFLAFLYRHTLRFNKSTYMLCASAFTALDFKWFRAYINKTYKWGYFPELKDYELSELLSIKSKNEKPKVLWVGRFIDWKHPFMAIEMAKRLKENNYDFELDIVGEGLLKQRLKLTVQNYGLQDCVHVKGPVSPKEVRTYMERSDIFLFTSDRNEGWGVVLNEAMNSACAVVANHMIGAVPYLMTSSEVGFVYEDGNLDDLYVKVERLIEDKELRKSMGQKANQVICESWNAVFATNRLIKLSESLLQGKPIEFSEGPCSKAEIMSEGFPLKYKLNQ